MRCGIHNHSALRGELDRFSVMYQRVSERVQKNPQEEEGKVLLAFNGLNYTKVSRVGARIGGNHAERQPGQLCEIFLQQYGSSLAVELIFNTHYFGFKMAGSEGKRRQTNGK